MNIFAGLPSARPCNRRFITFTDALDISCHFLSLFHLWLFTYYASNVYYPLLLSIPQLIIVTSVYIHTCRRRSVHPYVAMILYVSCTMHIWSVKLVVLSPVDKHPSSPNYLYYPPYSLPPSVASIVALHSRILLVTLATLHSLQPPPLYFSNWPPLSPPQPTT